MTSKKTLENCIYWQMRVIKQSRDPAQVKRCHAAIERLFAQLLAAA
jgi:hypothetical protein